MKRSILLLSAFLLVASSGVMAQGRTLKKVLELKMPKTAGDDMCGTRGAGVCWNPITKKYYAAFAGNVGYPLGVFDATGKLLSDEDLTTLQDLRGIWYNPVTKKIFGNTYNDGGWFSYKMDKSGIPVDAITDFPGMNQPDEQSVGAYNAAGKSVCFLNKGKIVFYGVNNATAMDNSLPIHFGRKKSDGPAEDENPDNENSDYNTNAIIYTGISNAEIGLLNVPERRIELYDIKLGFLQQKLKIPDEAMVESTFNFSYSNGIYWLFDMENRVWKGFK